MSPRVQNWFGNIVSSPREIIFPGGVADIVTVMKDRLRYPGIVRAVGSNHSTTGCGVAEGGTLLVMRQMNRIIQIGPDTVTVEAGALYVDVAKALEARNLQFYVNVEIGSLTMGAAATCGTKEASFPGELGQVSSYVTRIKMVSPAGDLVEITDDDQELLQVARSSYGLLGVVYEVTFRVRPMQWMTVHHQTFSLDSFLHKLPELKRSDQSIMLYLDPYLDRVTVELRRYHSPDDSTRASHWQWGLRNYIWRTLGPFYGHAVTNYVPVPFGRDLALDTFSRLAGLTLEWVIHGRNTMPGDQIIHYPPTGDDSRYTFSIWAYPDAEYPHVLRDYFDFCKGYRAEHGYRTNLMNVGYRIAQDQNSLLSYSFDGDVMTCDPVATGSPGWERFLHAYNRFAIEHHGQPLFNQTKSLTRGQVQRAFGTRLEQFERHRRRFDPDDRLLNPYFRALLSNGDGDPLAIGDEAHVQ